ncbi:MAG: hypothetical protein GY953_07325, partial [bacterium]|nr:hypothetical protein [bacterium]
LELRPEDTERVFEQFPFVPVSNLIVMTVDGWETVAYGKPYIYSLCAAPFARLFGANGVLLFNALLFLGMIVLGARYLARANESGLAMLFSAAFFGLSLASVYLFWLQPEIFGMAAVTASLYLSFVPPAPGARFGRLGRALLAGATLALVVFHKPMLLALCLPVLFGEVRSRRW